MGLINYLGESKVIKKICELLNVKDVKVNGTSVVDASGDAIVVADEVKQTNINDTSWHTIPMSKTDNADTETDTTEKCKGFRFQASPLGTSNTDGSARLGVGNNIASGTEDNYKGYIRVYDTGANYVDLYTETLSASRNVRLPNRAGLLVVTTSLTNENLNDIMASGFYVGTYGNTCTNRPSDVTGQFGLLVVKTASNASQTRQIMFSPSAESMWERQWLSSTSSWTSWKRIISIPECTKNTSGTYTLKCTVSSGSRTYDWV